MANTQHMESSVVYGLISMKDGKVVVWTYDEIKEYILMETEIYEVINLVYETNKIAKAIKDNQSYMTKDINNLCSKLSSIVQILNKLTKLDLGDT